MEDDKMEAAVDAVMVAVGCGGDGTVVATPVQVREWLRLAYGYGKLQGGADEKARLRAALSL